MRSAILGFAMVGVATVAQGESLTVGVEDLDYLPHYANESGVYSGFGAAILDAFAADEGYELTYRPLPVARLFKIFVEGGVDLKYPDNSFWSGDLKEGKDVVYSVPVTPYIDGVLVTPATFGKPADTYDRLGLVAGFTAWDWLDRINAGTVKTAENASFNALVRQALSGRVEAIYANVAVANAQLRQLGEPDALRFDDGLPHTRSNYHLSSIKRPDVIARFDAWMEANAAKVDALRAEYKVGEAFLR